MQSLVRVGRDTHIGHASPTPNPFHATIYLNPNQGKVTVERACAVVVGVSTACGDPAITGSAKVTVQNIPVHRVGDLTGGHGSWVPNAAATGSLYVRAG